MEAAKSQTTHMSAIHQLNLLITAPSPPAGHILPLHPWWRRLRERGGPSLQAQNQAQALERGFPGERQRL